MTDQIELLDVEGVDPPGDAVRDLIDPDKVRELAESIRSSGLLEPILVRPSNGRYEVVAGHRRLLAHKLLGEVKIKAIVKELSDEEVILVRAIENDQREDLNPIEKAKVYKRLQEKFGWSTRAIGAKMGRSNATIARYLNLLEIPEEFQKEVGRGRLSIEVALALNEIEDPDFRNYYFLNAVENGITLDVARTWVSDYKKTKAGSVSSEGGGQGDLGPVQESLPIYQTCVCCVGPVEVKRVRYIPVCPECEAQIRGALKPGKS
jgi:ParB family chromosome partitioning protein